MNGKNVDNMPESILYILAKLEMEKISIWKWETILPFDMEIHLPCGKVYQLFQYLHIHTYTFFAILSFPLIEEMVLY